MIGNVRYAALQKKILKKNRSYLKKRILVQDVGGFGFQTGVIRRYVEDLKPGPNTRLGPKDFFEMASNCLFEILIDALFAPKQAKRASPL